MKLYVLIFVVLVVLVQTYLSQAEFMESSLENDNAEHALNKRWQKAWGKRWQKAWGKRSEGDSGELYQHILRELYHSARMNQLEHPRYSPDNDLNPLTLEEFIAQRSTSNDNNRKEAKNMF